MLSSDVPYTDGQCLIRLCWWSELRTIVKCVVVEKEGVSVLFPTVRSALISHSLRAKSDLLPPNHLTSHQHFCE